MGISSILNVSKWALLTQELAVSITGHNIANVNTPGFSRQKVTLETQPPINLLAGQIGMGVKATEIKRVFDRFLGLQINAETENMGKLGAKSDIMEQVEIIFNESSGLGLNKIMGDFWNAWQDIANNPIGQTERVSLREKGIVMASTFNKIDSDLTQIQKDIDLNISGILPGINLLTKQIAGLNLKIAEVEIDVKQHANDHRDQRDLLLKELAEKIDINFIEDNTGQVTVFVTGGKLIVEKGITKDLVGTIDSSGLLDINWSDIGGNLLDITSDISGGKIGGLLEMRDTTINQFIDKIDSLAAGIINEINKQHILGYDLDGNRGGNLFSSLTATAEDGVNNTGGASVTGNDPTIYDPAILTRDNYEVEFSSSTTFRIRNVTEGTYVRNAFINGTAETADSDNAFTYTSGANILFEGITVVITGTGPVTGDTFAVSTTKDAAKNMALNTAIQNDVRKIAAAGDTSPGDNANALAIAALQDTFNMNNDTITFDDFYSALVGEVGVKAESAFRSLDHQESLVMQLENRRESISGVSLDEEMANLIKFEHAYGAAAKLISVVDEMMDIVTNMV